MTEQNNFTEGKPFAETWALVEIMGHSKAAGRISEESHFGTALLRIDIPTGPDSYFTQWYGGNAIYRITPIDETVARAFAENSQPIPVRPYELALPSPTIPADIEEDDWDPAF